MDTIIQWKENIESSLIHQSSAILVRIRIKLSLTKRVSPDQFANPVIPIFIGRASI